MEALYVLRFFIFSFSMQNGDFPWRVLSFFWLNHFFLFTTLQIKNVPWFLVRNSSKSCSILNKASWPTMRPQACMINFCAAFWALHVWLIISRRSSLVGVKNREEMRCFLVFKRKRDGPTDGRTDGRTDPLIEMRGRI